MCRRWRRRWESWRGRLCARALHPASTGVTPPCWRGGVGPRMGVPHPKDGVPHPKNGHARACPSCKNVPSVVRGGGAPAGRRCRHQPVACSSHELFAFVLGQSTPYAVRLAHRQCVCRTLRAHGAPHADLFGRVLASAPGCTALTLRMEEERAVDPTAGRMELPVPEVRVRTGKAGEICHCVSPCCRYGRICTSDRTSTILGDENMTHCESSSRHHLTGRKAAKWGIGCDESSRVRRACLHRVRTLTYSAEDGLLHRNSFE